MERYRNLDGDSGVTGYEIGSDFIRVQFHGNAVYLYTYSRAGRQHVETMKLLAVRGDGLNAYINRFVKQLYTRRER